VNISSNRRNLAVFGQGPLAVSVVQRLIQDKYSIGLVNDSEGTGGQLSTFAADNGIPTVSIHPRKNTSQLVAELRRSGVDGGTLLSINFRYIIDSAVLEKFQWPLNVHGSLLPRYRGRTPHVWAIINGEKETGITLHVMDSGVDTGPVVFQDSVQIPETMTGSELLHLFESLYPDLVGRGLRLLANGKEPQMQNDDNATYFGKRSPDMGIIDFRLPFRHLFNFVRAQAPPYPGAYCYTQTGRRVVVSRVHLAPTSKTSTSPKYAPYEVNGEVLVNTDDGLVLCDVESTQGDDR